MKELLVRMSDERHAALSKISRDNDISMNKIVNTYLSVIETFECVPKLITFSKSGKPGLMIAIIDGKTVSFLDDLSIIIDENLKGGNINVRIKESN